MDMESISWLYIVTSGQGIFLSIILFLIRGRKRGNILLSLLLLLLSVELWIRFDLYFNETPTLFTLLVLIESAGFLYGPVIYGYTLFTAGYRKRFFLKDFFHLVPALILLLFNIFYYLIPDYYLVPESEK